MRLRLRTCSGLVVEAYPAPVNFIRLLLWLASRPGFFIINKVLIPTPCIFSFIGFSSVSIPGNILMFPLHYWGFVFLVLWEGDPKWSERLGCNFRAIWTWGSVLILQAVSALVGRFIFPPTALSLHSYYLDCHFSLDSSSKRVSKVLVWTDSPLQAISWEVFPLPYVLVIPWQRRSWLYVYPSILWALFLCDFY